MTHGMENGTTVDTGGAGAPHQLSFDDPMGLTVNIINTAEAALREMSHSKSKTEQLELQPQSIYQGQVYYPSAALTGVSRQPQPVYYNLNMIESHNLHNQQQPPQRTDQIVGQSIVINYGEAIGSGLAPIPVQQHLSPLPPPPPVMLPESGGAASGPPRVQKKSNISSNASSKRKKQRNEGKKPKKKSLKKEEGHQGRKFICRFCSAGFSTQEYLGSHMNTVHVDKLKFQCSHCAKRFARSDQKNRHEAIHNPNRFQDKLKYPCRHCTKKFARSDQRKRHEGIHDPNRFQGEPKFSCDFCDKKYHLKGSLDGHRKRQHLGYVWKRKPKRQT